MNTVKDKQIEQEANAFAACLLIQKKFILEDLKNGIDLGDDNSMKELCKKYDVSLTMMAFRISLLNLKK